MRKIRSMAGLPVIVKNVRVGRVVRAELSEDLRSLTGLWMATGFFGMRFIEAENLGSIGAVAVTADHPGMRKKYKSESLFRRAVGTDGRRIGAITGATIDELSFCVEALELSFGLWEDLLNGRRHVRCYAVNQEDGFVIVDVSETEKEE